jgi:hypothetical protein
MYRKESTPTALANLTVTPPVKLPYLATSSANSSGSCPRTALVISTALLSGILGGALLAMAYTLLFGKCWKGKKTMQNDIKELKSKYEKVPQSGRRNPCNQLVYCRGCGLNQL